MKTDLADWGVLDNGQPNVGGKQKRHAHYPAKMLGRTKVKSRRLPLKTTRFTLSFVKTDAFCRLAISSSFGCLHVPGFGMVGVACRAGWTPAC